MPTEGVRNRMTDCNTSRLHNKQLALLSFNFTRTVNFRLVVMGIGNCIVYWNIIFWPIIILTTNPFSCNIIVELCIAIRLRLIQHYS